MRPLNGRPLLAYTIEAAVRSTAIHDVFVSTDSPEIQALAEQLGARVPYLRPPELCEDHVHGSVPIIHMLEHMGGAGRYDYCVQLLPTSPFKTTATIDAIVGTSIERRANVLSVTPTGKMLLHYRTLDEQGRLYLTGGSTAVNFQAGDAPEVYTLNGAIYCAPVPELLQYRTFQYGNPVGCPMHPLEAFDIDTELEFRMAERLSGLVEEMTSRA